MFENQYNSKLNLLNKCFYVRFTQTPLVPPFLLSQTCGRKSGHSSWVLQGTENVKQRKTLIIMKSC